MASATLEASLTITAGGESKGFDISKTISTSGKTCHDKQITVVGHGTAATNTYTVWDSTADAPFTSFSAMFVIVDAENDLSVAQRIDVRITANTTIVLQCDRNRPLFVGPSAQSTGNITKIEFMNIVSSLGNDPVARLLLLK